MCFLLWMENYDCHFELYENICYSLLISFSLSQMSLTTFNCEIWMPHYLSTYTLSSPLDSHSFYKVPPDIVQNSRCHCINGYLTIYVVNVIVFDVTWKTLQCGCSAVMWHIFLPWHPLSPIARNFYKKYHLLSLSRWICYISP